MYLIMHLSYAFISALNGLNCADVPLNNIHPSQHFSKLCMQSPMATIEADASPETLQKIGRYSS